MKLYQLDQDKILEYKIMRSHKEIADYKSKVINSTETMFYNLATIDQELMQKINTGENIDSGYCEEPTNNQLFMITPCYYQNKQRRKILTDYIEDLHHNPTCVKVENTRPGHYETDYFLLTQDPVKEDLYYTFGNAWKMPTELAGITLFDQEKYIRFLEDENLLASFPSELYQASQINEYDSKFLTTEIPGMEKMNELIEAEGKIISKIKTK